MSGHNRFNHNTKQSIDIFAKKSPVFKAGKNLKEEVNRLSI
ncbi:MAG: HU family DNA-binding protein [Ruthenibacterium lactatiformans]